MYINIDLIHSKGFTAVDVIVMQLLKQNETEDRENDIAMYISDDMIEKFEKEGISKLLKTRKKSDSDFKVMRLTKKGKTLLEEFQTPEVAEEDLKIYNWLAEIYQKTDREIGNKRKTKQWIAYFRATSGIDKNKLAFLCQAFIQDEKQFEYSKKLEFVFFKPPNLFSVKFELEQSRLYQYYIKRQSFFDQKFEEL